MSIPTQPTPTLIVTESLKLYGKATPSTSEITRGIDEGLEFVKQDLSNEGMEWDFLRTVAYLPLTINNSKVQCPTDMGKLIEVRLMDGTRRGTAQAAAAGTLTLASSDSGSAADTEGKLVVITGGTTGTQQARQITSYNSSTKVATLDSNWTTTPTGTITYLVVDERPVIDSELQFDFPYAVPSGTPTAVCHQADSAEGDIVFNRPPDKIYVAEVEYYADLMKVDIDIATSTLYNRFLRLCRNVLIQGVFVWRLQNDTRYTIELQRYESMKAKFAAKHLYPNNIQGLTMRLDY